MMQHASAFALAVMRKWEGVIILKLLGKSQKYKFMFYHRDMSPG